MRTYQSWGRYPQAQQNAVQLRWVADSLPQAAAQDDTLLPYGQGRSYGDSCLNNGGTLLLTDKLDRFIHFDRAEGLLRCEAGVTLADILRLIVPQGWFLPVTPGTKFVSVGGAIANDVHGKNHHRAGTFGCHVTRFELLRSDGSRLLCSPQKNAEWFAATVGGLGLTGLITWAEIRLKPIANPFISTGTIRFANLDEFFELTAAAEADYEYTVAWLDCLAGGRRFGRGLLMRGNHAAPQLSGLPCIHEPQGRSFPVNAPNWILNKLSIRSFNFAYYHRRRSKTVNGLSHFASFFYPLDALSSWNRIYGRRGFLQYQCVVPDDGGHTAIRSILEKIVTSGQGSFLSVLKTFGDIPSPGILSFPRKGVTLALDFPMRGAGTLALLDGLDAIVRQAGGRVYPAKDARMSPETFRSYYPQWHEFSRYIDPRFSSSFWRRVTAAVS